MLMMMTRDVRILHGAPHSTKTPEGVWNKIVKVGATNYTLEKRLKHRLPFLTAMSDPFWPFCCLFFVALLICCAMMSDTPKWNRITFSGTGRKINCTHRASTMPFSYKIQVNRLNRLIFAAANHFAFRLDCGTKIDTNFDYSGGISLWLIECFLYSLLIGSKVANDSVSFSKREDFHLSVKLWMRFFAC